MFCSLCASIHEKKKAKEPLGKLRIFFLTVINDMVIPSVGLSRFILWNMDWIVCELCVQYEFHLPNYPNAEKKTIIHKNPLAVREMSLRPPDLQ